MTTNQPPGKQIGRVPVISHKLSIVAEILFNPDEFEHDFIQADRQASALHGARGIATNKEERAFLDFLIATCEEYAY